MAPQLHSASRPPSGFMPAVRHGLLGCVLMAGLTGTGTAHADTIAIGIGHQSMCTDTYPAGIVVKELKLLEKHLPHDGKYAGAAYDIHWDDYASGGPITNQMLAEKLDIGVMGDYPVIVNGAKFQETKSLRTVLVSSTGYNLRGAGNAIVVPASSTVYSIEDLKGRSVSTPFGSAAWGMLVKALADVHLSLSDIELKNQAPAVGASNIAAGKIDAHADFCPWPEIMEYRGTGRKIYDGSETGVPYLHGIVVRKDFAERYPEIVVAFIEAIHDAGEWLKHDPVAATEQMEKWTGVEKEVLYLYYSKGGHLTIDPTLKPQWLDTLKFDQHVLEEAKLSPPLDFNAWIDDRYIKQAYADLKLDYAAESAEIIDPKVANRGLPNEVWHARDGIIAYDKLDDFLKAIAGFEASGAKLNATYVYDHDTGLKLFGKTAFYVQAADGSYATFLRKAPAEAYAATVSGKVLSFKDAVASKSS
jgi:NitT/TauT family transport system substrate-binding protein